MITFTRHSIDRPRARTLENVVVDNFWTIIKCEYTPSATSVLRRPSSREANSKPNEMVITHNFTFLLRHGNEPNRKLDMYIINMLYVDVHTKIVNRQNIRYYTMYSSRNYDNVPANISILDHTKERLANKELNSMFPFATIK
jgi:hypothetical protein